MERIKFTNVRKSLFDDTAQREKRSSEQVF